MKIKNLTHRQIAFYTTGILIIFVLFSISVLYWLDLWTLTPEITIILLSGMTLISYWVNNYFIRRYIYRRIKPIYKLIHDNKVSTSHSPIFRQKEGDIFELVSRDVESWNEEQQEKIKNLQILENYRREYLGNVSHELKTPIFNIQGYVHTLIDGAVDNMELRNRYFERTTKNIERLQTIVEDLEVISRLDLGEAVLEMVTFDIKKLTEEVFEDLEILAKSKNISVSFKEGASYNYKVIADKEYVRQVLINLITNSIKYGKENGYTKVGFYDMSTYLLIEVADNGIGIDKPHLAHVFDRFYRIDKGRSRDAGGSGLGLAIVKHIIEAHNQTINVRSTIDKGSTFGFTLQLAHSI